MAADGPARAPGFLPGLVPLPRGFAFASAAAPIDGGRTRRSDTRKCEGSAAELPLGITIRVRLEKK